MGLFLPGTTRRSFCSGNSRRRLSSCWWNKNRKRVRVLVRNKENLKVLSQPSHRFPAVLVLCSAVRTSKPSARSESCWDVFFLIFFYFYTFQNNTNIFTIKQMSSLLFLQNNCSVENLLQLLLRFSSNAAFFF